MLRCIAGYQRICMHAQVYLPVCMCESGPSGGLHCCSMYIGASLCSLTHVLLYKPVEPAADPCGMSCCACNSSLRLLLVIESFCECPALLVGCTNTSCLVSTCICSHVSSACSFLLCGVLHRQAVCVHHVCLCAAEC